MRQHTNTEPLSPNIPLEEAFYAFNEVSERLTESYQLLEQQVVGLTAELSEANNEKLKFLSEKEQLADQLESLLEFLPGAVIVLDAKKVVIKANACARKWLNQTLIGQDWEGIQSDELVASPQLDNEFLLRNQRVITLSKTSLQSRQGYVLLLTDITHQRELHIELEHKEKLAAMGRFSAGLAHQVRTPLSSALLYASQLHANASNVESVKKYSSKLLERLRHINNQVSDMLGYAHKGHFKKSIYNAQNVVLQLMNSYQSVGKQVIINADRITNDVSVEISKDALVGAVDNLINNAIEATPSDEVIRCCFDVTGNSLYISVSDKGAGLSEVEIQQIFEPFYTNKSEGTGLGLALVKEIATAHGGQITCHSEPTVGTTFTMELPVVIEEVVMEVEEMA